MNRLAVTGLSVLAAASLALTACSSGAAKTTSTPSTAASASTPAIPADATAALTAALADLTTTGFDFKETDGATGSGLSGTGSVDATTKSGSIEEKGTVQGANVDIAAVQLNGTFYAKVDLGPMNAQLGLPNTWMTIDPSKITSKNVPFNVSGGNLLDLAGVFTSVTNLQETTPGTITGVVDLTKATGNSAPDVSADGAKAATTPFTATLDAQGRLTTLAVDASAYDKDNSVTFTFSNYGSPSAITAPSGATPAPDGAYTFLNAS